MSKLPSSQVPPTRTSATRNLGILVLAGSVLLFLLGIFFTAEDVDQGSSVRIMYVHVPTAWVAYLAFILTAVASAGHLWGRRHSMNLDRLAGASAEVGVIFMGVTLVTGSLWGRLSWGTYWQWDPRLTTTAFLFVTYIGYLAVRGLGGTHQQRAKRSAIVALFAVLEIPLVHFSVVLWRSLHQKASVLRPNGNVTMDGLMLFTLMFGVVVFTGLFAWLVIHRQRLLAMIDAVEMRGIDAAIEARRAEEVNR
ncbi:MAG: cytochrome c-type biosis protein CcmC [Actinomycetota bacterium]